MPEGTSRVSVKVRVSAFTEVAFRVPVPILTVRWGRWEVSIAPMLRREMGAWPTAWRELPSVRGVVAPIYRWWALGPVEVRRFRWAEWEPA